jgi:deoxyribodipyrimidine photo-lyase
LDHPERRAPRISDVTAAIVWFRNDLRLADHPALLAGLGSGRPVVPVYVLDDESEGIRPAGAASRWWLYHSLQALDASLRALGSRLILRRGAAQKVLEKVAAECDASAIYWNRAYDQGARERDERLKQAFERRGLVAEGLKGNLLFEPWEVRTAANGDFKVFTAFWRACRTLPAPGEPLPAPKNLRPPGNWPESPRLLDAGRSGGPAAPGAFPRRGAATLSRNARPAGRDRHIATVALPCFR